MHFTVLERTAVLHHDQEQVNGQGVMFEWLKGDLALSLLNLHMSTAEIREACGCTRQHSWHLLHAYGANPNYTTHFPALMLDHREQRFDYWNFMLNTIEEKPPLLGDLLWIDEWTFTRSGIVNGQYVHYWSLVSPHIRRTVRDQIRCSTNLCCFTWETQIVEGILNKEIVICTCYKYTVGI